jgi:hypothetical protein
MPIAGEARSRSAGYDAAVFTSVPDLTQARATD